MRARLSYSDITKCTEDFKGAGGWRAASHAATCSVRFSAISEIQAVDGTFQCKGIIDLRWYDEAYENMPVGTPIPASQVKSLISQPYVKNSAGDMEVYESSPFVIVRELKEDPPGLCKFSWVFNGTCTEEFDLHEFPFDVQDLTVWITFQGTGMPTDEQSFGRIIFPEVQHEDSNPLRDDPWYLYGVHVNTLVEWTMFEPQVCVIGNHHQPASHHYVIKAQVMRKYEYFVRNVMMTTSSITTLSFAAFSIDGDGNEEGRLAIVSGFLLATVAFKSAMSDALPKVSYLTVLDKFFNANLTLVYILSFFIAVIRKIEFYVLCDRSDCSEAVMSTERFEFLSTSFFLVGWIVYHLWVWRRVKTYLDNARYELGFEIQALQDEALSLGVKIL